MAPSLMSLLHAVLLAAVLVLVTGCLAILLAPKIVVQILFHRYITAHEMLDKILKAKTFGQLCGLNGYSVQSHTVKTKDGYSLLLHRLLGKDENRFGRPVVYLHHGFGMSSEVWVCLIEPSRCLAFVLVERGYDVWLGNNRGNKYSGRSSDTAEFWDFSIDNFASNDIPDSISYILNSTKMEKLSYIGFSQGSAQAFAALSMDQDLPIDLLIALAPAISPVTATPLLHSLAKISPASTFRIFGRKSFFPPMSTFQSTVHPYFFSKAMDAAIIWLFGFRSENISAQQKVAAYAHLYSCTSVKVIVHWFQIMRNGAFCPYDADEKFQTKNIVTPIELIYGDSDGLLDMGAVLSELPVHTIATKLRGYEHLDILWGNNVHVDVLPLVLAALNRLSCGKVLHNNPSDEAHPPRIQ